MLGPKLLLCDVVHRGRPTHVAHEHFEAPPPPAPHPGPGAGPQEHSDEFPYADPVACARRLIPISGDAEMRDEAGIDPDRLKGLAAEAGVDLVDHEVITLLRAFGQDAPAGPVVSGPRVLDAMGGR